MPHPEASGAAKQDIGFIRHTAWDQSLAGHISGFPEAIFVLTGGFFSFPLRSQPDILV